MWNAPCDIFRNVQLQFEFSTLWKYNIDFPLGRENGLKFSTKLEVKSFMFHNVQSKSNRNSTHNAGSGKFSNKISTIE